MRRSTLLPNGKGIDGLGFTLIELLIVVAIIAILAAIAVPNFLEAQVRSKVSRARADSRTIVTAIEAYAVDYNKYPVPEFHPQQVRGGKYSASQFVPGGPHPITGSGSSGLVAGVTSPIAYLTTANLKDPFAVNVFDDQHDRMFYQNIDFWFQGSVPFPESGNPNRLTNPIFKEEYGSYKMGSVGPDQDYNGGYNIYDPTNGTVSHGDIYRSQKRPEGGGF